MTDYQKYINALRKCAKEHEGDKTFTGQIIVSNLCRDVADLLEEVEQEPKTGRWITTRTFMHDGEYYCDKCKCDAPNNEKWDYCPNCGAKMIEPQESEEV